MDRVAVPAANAQPGQAARASTQCHVLRNQLIRRNDGRHQERRHAPARRLPEEGRALHMEGRRGAGGEGTLRRLTVLPRSLTT